MPHRGGPAPRRPPLAGAGRRGGTAGPWRGRCSPGGHGRGAAGVGATQPRTRTAGGPAVGALSPHNLHVGNAPLRAVLHQWSVQKRPHQSEGIIWFRPNRELRPGQMYRPHTRGGGRGLQLPWNSWCAVAGEGEKSAPLRASSAGSRGQCWTAAELTPNESHRLIISGFPKIG